MSSPRYKPRSEYQTRTNDEDLDAVPDFAATALDRPVANVDDLRHAQLKQDVARDRREKDAQKRSRRLLVWAAIGVVAVALLVGSTLGAYLAFR
ncbi:MAG: hypothetical protein H6719_25765 [Sandaracinaceae bacterium]|nr:hypothetical protein [Sandaracinaceae bacterium]